MFKADSIAQCSSSAICVPDNLLISCSVLFCSFLHVLILFSILAIKPQVLHMLDKQSNTELHPQDHFC